MFSLNAGVSILTILFVSSGLVQGSPNGTLRQLVTDSDKNTSNIDPPFDSNNPKFHTESSVFQASIGIRPMNGYMYYFSINDSIK